MSRKCLGEELLGGSAACRLVAHEFDAGVGGGDALKQLNQRVAETSFYHAMVVSMELAYRWPSGADSENAS